MLWCSFCVGVFRESFLVGVEKESRKSAVGGRSKKYYFLDTQTDVTLSRFFGDERQKKIYISLFQTKNQKKNQNSPPPPFFFVSVENTTTNTPKRVVDTPHDTHTHTHRERERELFLLG